MRIACNRLSSEILCISITIPVRSLQAVLNSFQWGNGSDHPTFHGASFELPLTDPRHPFHVVHMELAIQEAETAADEEEVPVGAVIVSLKQGVIGQAHNQREQLRDPTAHAEMIAITQAAKALGSWRLEGCVLYVTLEPCPMCAGAIVQARLPLVVYGAADPKAGACDTLYQITSDQRLNHRCLVISGVQMGRCADLLSGFFAKKRRQDKG